MKNTNLYRIHSEEKLLQAVKEINFADFNFKERYDIQEWVESTPEVLGEELLIIAKELSYFDSTRERADLVAIDKQGNIVVIELKRDDSGTGVEWQAIKYASYLSKFKVSDIVNIFVNYLEKINNKNEVNEEIASQMILDFIDEDDLTLINKNQRIILVSHRFAKEVTSAVNWLIEKHDMDAKVVQLIPYYDQDKNSYYIQSNTILPIPGEDDLIIKASGKTKFEKNYGVGPVKKSDEVALFFNDLKIKLSLVLDKELMPTKTSRWAGVGNNFRYFHFWYENSLWDNRNLSYKIWLFDNTNSKKERRNNFGIYFDFYKKYLLEKGITEERLNDLIKFTKNVNIEGFNFHTVSNNGFYLEKLIKNDGLSDKVQKILIDVFKKLIEETKIKVDECLYGKSKVTQQY